MSSILDHLGEEAVDGQPREKKDRELRDTLCRAQELTQYEVVHQELNERTDQRPEEPQDAIAIAGLQVTPNEKTEQNAAIEDLSDLASTTGEPQSACIGCRKRGLGNTGEPISRVQVLHLRQSTA